MYYREKLREGGNLIQKQRNQYRNEDSMLLDYATYEHVRNSHQMMLQRQTLGRNYDNDLCLNQKINEKQIY